MPSPSIAFGLEGLGIRLMRGFLPAFPNTGLPNGVCGPRRDNQTKEDLIFLNWQYSALGKKGFIFLGGAGSE